MKWQGTNTTQPKWVVKVDGQSGWKMGDRLLDNSRTQNSIGISIGGGFGSGEASNCGGMNNHQRLFPQHNIGSGMSKYHSNFGRIGLNRNPGGGNRRFFG